MPLTESVTFKAKLQRGNRIQVPRLYRWHYKMEPDQALQVIVTSENWKEETFIARMSADGRITIPKLTLDLLKGDAESLSGSVLEVALHPLSFSGEADKKGVGSEEATAMLDKIKDIRKDLAKKENSAS